MRENANKETRISSQNAQRYRESLKHWENFRDDLKTIKETRKNINKGQRKRKEPGILAKMQLNWSDSH